MNKQGKSLYRKTALCIFSAAAVLLSVILPVFHTDEPKAIYADANDNSSVYYISNTDASQENTASLPPNSRNVKNYTVRIQDEKISIFEGNNPIPLYSIDTPPSHLPEADLLLLETGISVNTFEEACRLIEDYE